MTPVGPASCVVVLPTRCEHLAEGQVLCMPLPVGDDVAGALRRRPRSDGSGGIWPPRHEEDQRAELSQSIQRPNWPYHGASRSVTAAVRQGADDVCQKEVPVCSSYITAKASTTGPH
jgi:hypothetical protein